MMHEYHDSDLGHIIYDACERCNEYGNDPFRNLDGSGLRALVHRILMGQDQYGERLIPGDNATPFLNTENEVRAMRVIKHNWMEYQRIDKAIAQLYDTMRDDGGECSTFPFASQQSEYQKAVADYADEVRLANEVISEIIEEEAAPPSRITRTMVNNGYWEGQP